MTTLTESRITPGAKLDPEHQKQVIEEFHREGVALVRGVLTPDEVAALREFTDRTIDREEELKRGYVQPINKSLVLRCTQSLDRIFCDLLIREPFLSLAEAILGPDCGFCGQNVIRTTRGQAISYWHVDDTLENPLPPAVPRYDAKLHMPVHWFSYQIVLSDIETIEHGPTQYVPTSHYSGRDVPSQEEKDMVFDGRKAVPVFAKAGDIYLFNHQTWHRGSPNASDRTRYLMQNQYAKAWLIRRFAGEDITCKLPQEELEGAPDRLLRLLRRGK